MDLTKIIDNAVNVVAFISVVAPFVVACIKALKARTKNQKLQVIESYALRVVQAVEQNRNLLPSDKKALAKDKLAKYLSEAGIKITMTDDNLSDAVEQAVNTVKAPTGRGQAIESKATAESQSAVEKVDKSGVQLVQDDQGRYVVAPRD